jgi:hypothetical protein
VDGKGKRERNKTMELQVGLAIVDEMNGGKETKRRMDGWMNGESRAVRRLRHSGARALVALAARLTPEPIALPEPQRAATRGSVA